MTNTFEQIKNNIITEFSNYKIEDIGYDNYDFTTEEGVEEFLFEHTNQEWSWDNYFADDIIDWDMSNTVLMECMNYVNEGYNDMIGEDIPFNMINNEDKIKRQMIYWIGYEIKLDLIGENIEEEEEEEIEEDSDYEEDIKYEMENYFREEMKTLCYNEVKRRFYNKYKCYGFLMASDPLMESEPKPVFLYTYDLQEYKSCCPKCIVFSR